MLGFVTAESPNPITAAVGEGMTTVMVPLAPNPATNGVILHLADDRLRDVDLTVEETIQVVMTLGMAVEDGRLDADDS